MSFNLKRFKEAQSTTYENALSEIKNGKKVGHWIWFVFPQLEGLGSTPTSHYYSIKSLEEAQAYLKDSLLRQNLLECIDALLSLESDSANDIFGYPDVLKVRSCLTLFEKASKGSSEHHLFSEALEKYYQGERDQKTLQIIKNLSQKEI